MPNNSPVKFDQFIFLKSYIELAFDWSMDSKHTEMTYGFDASSVDSVIDAMLGFVPNDAFTPHGPIQKLLGCFNLRLDQV